MDPLRGMPGTPEALCFIQPQSWLVFTARSYENLSSQHWNPTLGGLMWGWDPLPLRGTSIAEISLLILICHTWVWDQRILHLHPSYQSMWLLLYIFSYRTAVQLDFR